MMLSVALTILVMFIKTLPQFLKVHFGISTLLTGHVINLSLNLLLLMAAGERDFKKTMFYALFSYVLWFTFSLGFAGLLDLWISSWIPSLSLIHI